MGEGMVAFCMYMVIAIPVTAVTAIIWFNRKRRVKKFTDNPNEEGYVCPVCHMSNDTKGPCERCGFHPETKEANVAYDKEKVDNFMDMIGKGI